MINEKPQVFIDISADELMTKVEDYDARGWRFVNICGSAIQGGVELIYSFSNGLPMENLRFTVENGSTIPSVSGRFPNAFFFENETYDLFGVRFSGISIDFDGKFYKVSIPTPMNPDSVQARKAAYDSAPVALDVAIDATEVPIVASVATSSDVVDNSAPSAVIPAQAKIHTHDNDSSAPSSVIPAQAGIHTHDNDSSAKGDN